MWPRVIPYGNLSLKAYWLVVKFLRTRILELQQDNLHLISADSDATSMPLRYDVVEEEF
jgi:hypothetical protein